MTSALLFYRFKEKVQRVIGIGLNTWGGQEHTAKMWRVAAVAVWGGQSSRSTLPHNHMWDLCCHRSTLHLPCRGGEGVGVRVCIYP